MSNVDEQLKLLSELASDMADDETKACVFEAETSLRAHIAALEAENKRLREKLAEAESGRLIEVMRRKLAEPCENCDDTGLYSVGGIDNMPCPCKSALAQTGGV